MFLLRIRSLCYSVAEYAAPVWARSHHAHLLDSKLNTAYRAITGCLKPPNVEDLYLLAGIAPPEIRRDVCARVEKKKQESNVAHSIYGQTPTESRLKYISCFHSSLRPADFHPNLTESLARGNGCETNKFIPFDLDYVLL